MECRIVLVGKTGSGKSSCGNTILKGRYFEAKFSPTSVTKKCEVKKKESISVVDTPGIFDTSLTPEELETEIGQFVEMSLPGPHAFLLVIRLGRFTEEEERAVEWIKNNFGVDALPYTIVLFTHGDQLGETTIEQFIADSPQLNTVISTCGGGYHVFNNKDQRPDQVETLMAKINEMVNRNGGKFYTNEMYRNALWKRRVADAFNTVRDNAPFVVSVLAGAVLAGFAVLRKIKKSVWVKNSDHKL